ncbi:MAG: MATE family efflux transporter [Oscillospiraceae bacterium]
MAAAVMGRTSATINKKYTEYLLPTVLTAMATNIANIVDSMMAGNLLGVDALSAISILSPISQLYFALTVMFGLGASSVIAVAKGKNDAQKANRIFTAELFVLGALCVILIAVQLIFADGICSLLITGDDTVHALVYDYYIPFIIGTPLQLFLLCAIYIVRADNRPRFSSNIIIIANVVNLAMDYVFMGVLDMGIKGSSWATVTGNLVGFIILMTHFISGKSTVRFDFSVLKKPREFFGIIGEFLTVGLSGALGTMLITVKLFFLNTVILDIGGTDGMIAYSVCRPCQILISMFITGASQTMILLTSVCLGEKDYDGIRYAFRRAFSVLAVASAVITLGLCAFPEPFIKLFGVTLESDIANAIPAMQINALSLPFLALSFLLLYYYMSTKRKALSTTIAVLNGIGLQIPASLILGNLFGLIGIWWSFVAAQVGTVVVVYIITLVIRKKSKGKYKNFYLLDTNDNDEITSISFKSTKDNASAIPMYLELFLESHGIEKNKANRVAVAIEGFLGTLAQRSENKKDADIDIRIMSGDDEIIISIRSNGKLFNFTETDTDEEMSDISVVKAISKSVEYSSVLGFNRLIIKI